MSPSNACDDRATSEPVRESAGEEISGDPGDAEHAHDRRQPQAIPSRGVRQNDGDVGVRDVDGRERDKSGHQQCEHAAIDEWCPPLPQPHPIVVTRLYLRNPPENRGTHQESEGGQRRHRDSPVRHRRERGAERSADRDGHCHACCHGCHRSPSAFLFHEFRSDNGRRRQEQTCSASRQHLCCQEQAERACHAAQGGPEKVEDQSQEKRPLRASPDGRRR